MYHENIIIACSCSTCIIEYLGIDPTIIRLGFVALSLLAGGGLAVYIIAAIIMPDREGCSSAAENTVNTCEYEKV